MSILFKLKYSLFLTEERKYHCKISNINKFRGSEQKVNIQFQTVGSFFTKIIRGRSPSPK